MSNSWRPHGLWPPKLLCPWDSPGKHTGVDCHFLLQGIFPTQGSNPGLLHWQVDSLPCDPPRKPLLRHLQLKPCGKPRREWPEAKSKGRGISHSTLGTIMKASVNDGVRSKPGCAHVLKQRCRLIWLTLLGGQEKNTCSWMARAGKLSKQELWGC